MRDGDEMKTANGWRRSERNGNLSRICVLSIWSRRVLAVNPPVSPAQTALGPHTARYEIKKERREIRNSSTNYCTRRLNGKIIII